MYPYWIQEYLITLKGQRIFAENFRNMEKQLSLGKLIQFEVYKQNLSVEEFAGKINCTRTHVYKIFGKSTLDVELLGRISKVLNHNFFVDIADNLELAKPTEETEEEKNKRMAICQLFDLVPEILHEMGYNATIVRSSNQDAGIDVPIPDFMLSDYYITFTLGETYEERANGVFENAMKFDYYSDEKGNKVCILTGVNGTQTCDIKLEYKTREQWKDLLILAFKTIKTAYYPSTWESLKYNQYLASL